MNHLSSNNETTRVNSNISVGRIRNGTVNTIDTQKQELSVKLDSKRYVPCAIGNPVTNYGAGLKIIPMAGMSKVIIYEDAGGTCYHIGYDLSSVGSITDDRLGKSQENNPLLLKRHLVEGDVQLSGTYGSEIFLPIDGSILLKNSLGSSLYLDNYMSRLEGNFANTKFEMDGVRLRMGNIIRPTVSETTEDQYMVRGSKDDKIKGADSLDKDEDYLQLREFTVQVGTIQDPDNKYRDYVSDNPKDDLSPSIGEFSISDAYVRENGKPYYMSLKPVQCFLKMRSGGGFMIGDDGSFYVMDYNNYSSTKLSSEDERALRLRKSYITVAKQDDDTAEYETEIKLSHESNAGIEIREGYVQLQEKTGRYFLLNEYGAMLNAPEASINIISKDINLMADGGSVSIGGFPTDGVIKATYSSLMFDTHVHMGPSGPPLPSFQWTPMIQIPNSPLVAQGFKVT